MVNGYSDWESITTRRVNKETGYAPIHDFLDRMFHKDTPTSTVLKTEDAKTVYMKGIDTNPDPTLKEEEEDYEGNDSEHSPYMKESDLTTGVKNQFNPNDVILQ